MVWVCVSKRRHWLGEETYGVWSGGCQAKRLTKDNLERDCGKRLSGTWIEQGRCHGSYWWKKEIRDDWWPRQVWVGECFFWYWLTRFVPDKIHRTAKWLCVCVRAVVAAVLMDTGFVNGKPGFRPQNLPHLYLIARKFVTHDYIGDPYCCTRFDANLPTGISWAFVWNITNFFYIYCHFGYSPTSHTARRIFTCDSSNDADSCKRVPFLGFVDIADHLGDQICQKIGVVNKCYQPNVINIETFVLS